LIFYSIKTVSSEDAIITNENPSNLAEIILKDLFYRAHLNNISACIQPILMYEEKKIIFFFLFIFFSSHLDNHKKWIPVDFPKYIFSNIMNSIKVFYLNKFAKKTNLFKFYLAS